MGDTSLSNRNNSPTFLAEDDSHLPSEAKIRDAQNIQQRSTSPQEPEYEELDPRVQEELEKLNLCTDKINEFELQLEEANAVFRTLLTDSTHQLKSSATRVGASNIEKARPYYEALDVSNKAQKECQSAATNYQRASGIHAAAKETIALAEARFTEKKSSITNLEQGSIEFIPPDTLNNISETDSAISGGDQCPLLFDSAWQEMLNHATMKVMEAESLKTASEAEHAKRAAFFTKAEQEVQQLEKKLKKHIQKSRPYFEEKDAFNKTLESQKKRVHKLQDEVRKSKADYANSLRALEDISESIHARRKLRMQYKMDFIKSKASAHRDVSADGRSQRIPDESDLNYNLDEVDAYLRRDQERGRQNFHQGGVSSISSSSCYGGSGSLEDLASTEHDFSSTRSVSGKSESSLATAPYNVESTNLASSVESTQNLEKISCSKSDSINIEDIKFSVIDFNEDISTTETSNTPSLDEKDTNNLGSLCDNASQENL